jgi:hypothetical protein
MKGLLWAKTTVTLQQIATLFDHLVGPGEQRRWHRDAERLSSLKIDGEIKSRRQQHRQFGRLGALENTSSGQRQC